MQFDAQDAHAVIHGRPGAVMGKVLGERRHEIGDVANIEDFARRSVENFFGRDTQIAAADHQRVRVLAPFRQFMKIGPLPTKIAVQEAFVALHQLRWKKLVGLGRSIHRHPLGTEKTQDNSAG